MRNARRLVPAIVIAARAVAFATGIANATIIDEWASVKPEPAPELKAVTIDPKTTALLVLDIVKGACNDQRRPRCVASVPAIAKLIENARAKGLTVIHTVPGKGTAADILPQVAPKQGEQLITGTVAEKFVRTDLEKILKDKGITTIIPVGTAAHGAILYTSSQAAFLGIKVVVPVDGASSENSYAEQAVVWLLARAPGVSNNVTLIKLDISKF